jgi:hypothetical protein
MSIGNLKTYGNKGNNFPFQLATLKGLALSQIKNITESTVTNATVAGLEADINSLLALNPNSYLISKSVVYDSATPEFVAFLSIATL